jgi:hypothetical protein
MRITAIINDDTLETYKSKQGAEVKKRVLALVDVGEGVKLKQIIEWNAPDDFKPEQGKAVGQRIVLDITEIGMFGQRPRVRAVAVPQAGK